MKKYVFIGILLSVRFGFSQDRITGMVMTTGTGNDPIVLAGANVYWMDSQLGTMTDEEGRFSISFRGEYRQLIISYVGFESDTLTIDAPKVIHHFLRPSNALDEVVVEKNRDAVEKTFLASQNIVNINSAELLKAACCNLSESFETNPAIDVNFNDALTGTRQIQMLGLTSPYLLITQENIPMVRGASQTYGLTFTPGTWIESIQITKGAGSVVNGYESISGQINTELVKPFLDKAFFVNGYYNVNGRQELNAHFNKKLTPKWSSGLYLHGHQRNRIEENNGDGFLDAPLTDHINLMNRWQYQDPENGWVSFINVRVLNDEKQIGEVGFDPDRWQSLAEGFVVGEAEPWGGEVNTRRFDSSIKLGYVFPELPFQSMGFQASYSLHKQASYFGFNRYDIDHQSIYSNFILNSIIGDTRNKFKTGLTFAYDGYEELVNTGNFNREDRSLGAFFEYSFEDLDKLSLTAGLRVDEHNRLGTFVTPRFHIRYTPWERASLRGSFGRGRRAANFFAENQQVFASSREIRVLGSNGPVYGLDPEDAWNYGAGFLQGFSLFGRSGNVSLDYYRTDFTDQVVVDWENPDAISFYNLEGKSFANGLQLELNYELANHLEVRTAYKIYDVKTDYNLGRLQKPLLAQNRFFANLGYTSPPTEKGRQWRLDYTLHAVGKQRLPDTGSNPEPYRLQGFSSPYTLMNAQVTRVFSPRFEWYLGGENLTGVRQENPILGSEDPFGPNFDTTIVYAPIMGRMLYTGFRFKSR
ncbi:MAG: TonB-dependent receptor [Bacteroidota bacterium]